MRLLTITKISMGILGCQVSNGYRQLTCRAAGVPQLDIDMFMVSDQEAVVECCPPERSKKAIP